MGIPIQIGTIFQANSSLYITQLVFRKNSLLLFVVLRVLKSDLNLVALNTDLLKSNFGKRYTRCKTMPSITA